MTNNFIEFADSLLNSRNITSIHREEININSCQYPFKILIDTYYKKDEFRELFKTQKERDARWEELKELLMYDND